MKKLVAFACAALVLAGCGSSGVKKESKTCSMEQYGMTMDFKLDAEDDIVKTMQITLLMPESLTSVDASKLSEEDLKTAGEAGLANIGLDEKSEGIEVEVSAKDKDMLLTVTLDLTKADADVLKSFNMSGDAKELKLSELVKSAEESDSVTCK